MAAVSSDYVRLCPTCGAQNAPEVMRCACGALLAGLDLVRVAPAEATPSPETVPATGPAAPSALICPHDDCGQPNPPGSTACLYCNRPLAAETPPPIGLLTLPAALRERFRIVRPLPANGAEAEILLVEPLAGGPAQVAKIYRAGIRPKAEVLANIARIDPKHRIETFETGVSDGHAWELMEYCAFGSLRERLAAGPIVPALLQAVIRELATALADVHKAQLVHRDVKPENILIRSEAPLDLILTDFGTASVLDATQRFTGTARTLPYAAPETLSGVIDAKADWWALGMIVLEIAQGKHPFAGLSEAVILHHLATRTVDLAGVADRNVKKLLRGLLARDPKARWGAGEVERWLAGDPSLPEPREAETTGFAEPYRIAKEVCQTPEQLALALAHHWRIGIADLGNGQLLTWFRTVQKDHNTVRLMLEMQHERQLHVDIQLLRLILHLAPGIPPIWRGESIELPTILGYANRALQGDAEAAHWLGELHRQRVLQIYAEAGNAMAADIVERWSAASDRFTAAWAERQAWLKARAPARAPDEVVDFDTVMFGHHGPSRPPDLTLHPRLLAAAYDPAWADWLRKKLRADIAGLAATSPWLAELGDPQAMSPADLLVTEALLPEARKAAERERRKQAALQQSASEELREVRQEAEAIIATLRHLAFDSALMPADCEALIEALGRYQDVLSRIRCTGRSDEPWQQLRTEVARIEMAANRLQETVESLIEHRAANAGWQNMATLFVAVAFCVIVPIFIRPAWRYLPLFVMAGIAAWRILPVRFYKRQIRDLAARL